MDIPNTKFGLKIFKNDLADMFGIYFNLFYLEKIQLGKCGMCANQQFQKNLLGKDNDYCILL